MKYTATMTTTLETESLDVIKKRFDDLSTSFPDAHGLDLEGMIGKENMLMESVTLDGVLVKTYLRIDCDRGEKPQAKILDIAYPTLAEVDQASAEQIEDWYENLRGPANPDEAVAQQRIGERIRETRSQGGTRDPQM